MHLKTIKLKVQVKVQVEGSFIIIFISIHTIAFTIIAILTPLGGMELALWVSG